MATTTTVNLQDKTLRAFDGLFSCRAREVVAYGGAGAGKSYAVAQKMIMMALGYDKRRIVCIRKYGPSLKLTSWRLILDLLDDYGIPYKANHTDLNIRLGKGSEMIFMPVVNTKGAAADRLKSLTDIDQIWIEEATELSFEEYNQIMLRLRGEPLKEGYRQIILTLNPIDKNHWIYRRFVEGGKGALLKYTYHDNPYIEQEYCDELEALRGIDDVMYSVYALGEWGVLGHIIYTKYEIEEIEQPLGYYEEFIAGVDYAFEKPSAWLLIGLRENKAYVLDEVYERRLLNSEFAELIADKQREWGVRPQTYCDTAEPGRIEEMYRAGLNVYEADKNVSDGINCVKEHKLILHPRCINTMKEIRGYVRKRDKNGEVLDEPVKANDHAMDALRYALYTHRQSGEAYGEDGPSDIVDFNW